MARARAGFRLHTSNDRVMGTSDGMATDTAAQPTPDGHRPRWGDRLASAATWITRRLSQPRVKLGTAGLVLLLLGMFVVTGSAWTAPVLVVGAAMLVVAWIGSRIDGRMLVEWGQQGTGIELQAHVRPAPALPAAPLAAPAPVAVAAVPTDAEIVEGEAHTIEIDVAELKSLIAAAEAADAARQAAAPVRPVKAA